MRLIKNNLQSNSVLLKKAIQFFSAFAAQDIITERTDRGNCMYKKHTQLIGIAVGLDPQHVPAS
jgi:hypothetical protein